MPNFKKSRFFFEAFYCISLLARFFRSSALNESLKQRGYYMAARRYEISLRVLKNIALTREIFFQHEERNFVSPSGHVMFSLLYKHQWNTNPFHFNSFLVWKRDLLWSHSNGDIFTCEYNMLFSHVKISSFRAKAHLVFHWCLYNKG